MIWVFDIDGVITANPAAISWLTWHLKKNENNNKVFIVTWRDGSNVDRFNQTHAELDRWGIVYDAVFMAPKHYSNLQEAARWKISKVESLRADIWFDDEIKIYRRDYKIDLEKELPEVEKVWI